MKYSLFVLGAVALGIAACAGTKQTVEQNESEAFDDLRAEVTATVAAPERQQRALDTLDDLEAALLSVDKNMEERLENTRQINANYDATEAEIIAFSDAIRGQMKSNFDELHTHYRQFRAQLTDEEWDTINKSSSKAMEAAVAALLDR